MIYFQFQNTSTILNTITFSWLIGPKTDRYGPNSIPYRANQIWNLLPRQIKNSANVFSINPRVYLKVQLTEQMYCDASKDIESILCEREKYWQC